MKTSRRVLTSSNRNSKASCNKRISFFTVRLDNQTYWIVAKPPYLFSHRFRSAPVFCERVDLSHPSFRSGVGRRVNAIFAKLYPNRLTEHERQKRSSCGRRSDTKDRSVKDADLGIVPGEISLNADSVHWTRVYERPGIFFGVVLCRGLDKF